MRHPRLAAAAAGALLLGISATGSSASPTGVIPTRQATVSPNPVTAGQDVFIAPEGPDDGCDGFTITAAGRSEPSQIFMEFFILDPQGQLVPGSEDHEPIDGSGQWGPVRIPTTGWAPGLYTFEGECDFSGAAASDATVAVPVDPVYEETFEVVAGLSASLDRSSGPAGTNPELTAIVCAGPQGAAAFMPAGEVPKFSKFRPGLQRYDVLEGQFGGVVPVPADTAPGEYQIVVWCLDDEGDALGEPIVLGYTVTAPGAAAPVVAAPRFTG